MMIFSLLVDKSESGFQCHLNVSSRIIIYSEECRSFLCTPSINMT